jgi:hypothetical protein
MKIIAKEILFVYFIFGVLMFLVFKQEQRISELEIQIKEQEIIEQTARYMISDRLNIR